MRLLKTKLGTEIGRVWFTERLTDIAPNDAAVDLNNISANETNNFAQWQEPDSLRMDFITLKHFSEMSTGK